MRLFALIALCIFSYYLQAQHFSHQDTLRGSVTPERIWWDLVYYDLQIEVLPSTKQIKGSNIVQYRVLEPSQTIQIDLQEPLQITRVTQDGQQLDYRRDGNAYFIFLVKKQKKNDIASIKIDYEGSPKEAINAPWDGGLTWTKDEKANDFIATSCQGLGASVWWPCKDHMYDEVDSMHIRVEVPENLVDISNGKLIKVDEDQSKNTKTYHYFVDNPINNYGVNINIGNYVTWAESYDGLNGPLEITYAALEQDEKAAREQFQEVPRMLEAFEHWFGPYPFYEDGYKLVQAPYLGMEHQSSITYGNGFQNGYRGRDLSGTGWGLKFDFIIVHESGHEWFANNITHKDQADMWIHESFTAYSESLFVEYFYGKIAGQEYVLGTRQNIENAKPMVGHYHVNDDSYPIDVYYKGSNMLNTLRTVLDDDDRWLLMMREINKEFYHQTVTSQQIETWMAAYLGLDLAAFFDQYLRDRRVPIFEYYVQNENLMYRWSGTNAEFNMPVDLEIDGGTTRIFPTANKWQRVTWNPKVPVILDNNYYVATLKSR